MYITYMKKNTNFAKKYKKKKNKRDYFLEKKRLTL